MREASPGNVAPRILSRAEHVISRKNIDPDALKVLYRLKNHGFVAYLVGGGVRDLLLERRPKDFDISTSAHPQQVKKLFRNCFIVGRRFRLCHVRFGNKVIEVSTFRRQAEPEEGDTLIRRDNTFGSPEEDAFRRDFTVNALFYDIATFSVIDWVGGLSDLRERVIRTIGDPGVRFREDPVRMLRAVALAARLDFTIDGDTVEAIRALRGEIVRSSSARVLEEFYKILRQGRSRETFLKLNQVGLLAYLLPEADRAISGRGDLLLGSLGRLDDYRAGVATAEQLTNPLLMGSLLVPLGVPLRRVAVPSAPPRREEAGREEPPVDLAAEIAALGGAEEEEDGPPGPATLVLPFARRDLDRLRLILVAQRRLREAESPASARQALRARAYFEEALRWLEIHGGPEGPSLADSWRRPEPGGGPPGPEPVAQGTEPEPHAPPGEHAPEERRPRRRRRRRRRRPPLDVAGSVQG
ncbi:MAG TPA: polynucleotide adenylyltransferase PcnB [Vicinamibacteria bacterium]|nr:polynucleotide adenylyltransferase PcnB [Vicinamibacteria bacterium]